MTGGPLRRFAGVAGLAALTPTAVLLAQGVITPIDAALRGVATFVAAVGVARLAGWYLRAVATSMERAAQAESNDAAAGDAPQRRATDAGRRRGAGTSG
jgi:hypothetical protein